MRNYCVYEHVFPNGKKYIGISCDAEKRWRNGKGYETQGKIANAIKRYGWENVKHNIIVDGISKEQAQTLEQYLIAELNTIKGGYNTSIGGDYINACYISSYLLAMIRGGKSYAQVKDNAALVIADNARADKEAAEFWNEAENAVTAKHGKYSATSRDGCASFWHCMLQYCVLHIKRMNGEDVSKWREMPPPMEGRHA